MQMLRPRACARNERTPFKFKIRKKNDLVRKYSRKIQVRYDYEIQNRNTAERKEDSIVQAEELSLTRSEGGLSKLTAKEETSKSF